MISMSYTSLVSQIEKKYLYRKDSEQQQTNILIPTTRIPVIHSGDLLRVGLLIKEGNKSRIQPFEGTVLSIQNQNNSTTIILRRLSRGISVERVLLIYSNQVAMLQVLRESKVNRAKLYYLRNTKIRRIRLKEKLASK
nr:ribosomal protein L19 [Entransia fimbriata]